MKYDVIKTFPYKDLDKLFLISKLSFDRSSGVNKKKKQKFEDKSNLNNDNDSNADANICTTSLTYKIDKW
jgi:hypothetical protein